MQGVIWIFQAPWKTPQAVHLSQAQVRGLKSLSQANGLVKIKLSPPALPSHSADIKPLTTQLTSSPESLPLTTNVAVTCEQYPIAERIYSDTVLEPRRCWVSVCLCVDKHPVSKPLYTSTAPQGGEAMLLLSRCIEGSPQGPLSD